MIDSSWNTNAIPPNEIFIDAIVLWRLTIGKRLYGKSLFEKEHTYRLHHVDSINLRIEKSLFAPHASDKEILFFKKQWEYPVQNVNGSFYFLYEVFILEDLVLCSCVVHDFNALKITKNTLNKMNSCVFTYVADNMNYVISFVTLLDCTEVREGN